MSHDSQDPSFLKAFEDLDFLRRDELRPVRLMLELMKADMLQHEAGIRSTIVVFGSARIKEHAQAQAELEEARRGSGFMWCSGGCCRVWMTRSRLAARCGSCGVARDLSRARKCGLRRPGFHGQVN